MVNFRGLLRDGFRENYKSEKRGQDIYKLSRVEVPSTYLQRMLSLHIPCKHAFRARVSQHVPGT